MNIQLACTYCEETQFLANLINVFNVFELLCHNSIVRVWCLFSFSLGVSLDFEGIV